MAVLILFWLLLPATPFSESDTGPIAVLFDASLPENSVGIIGNQIVEIGSVYDHYQIRSDRKSTRLNSSH